jgi:dihydrofolate reductase
MFNMIAAVSHTGIIGIDNKIPWHCRADLQRFKKITMDNVVIMGKKTFLSLFDHMKDKDAEPLPGRFKYVVTHDRDLGPKMFRHNIISLTIDNPSYVYETVEYLQKQHPDKDIFVIGGSQIYKLFEGFYKDIYLTRVFDERLSEKLDGDVHFLPLKESVLMRDYRLLYVDSHNANEDNECPMVFEQWRLKNSYGE